MPNRATRRLRLLYWIGGGAWCASGIFLLRGLSSYPLELWDESRVAVNAMEMFLTGPRLVTTYDFKPDLWNTKPPLLVWLMNASMTAFGPSEFAIRLPSALAAIATVALAMWFARRLTGAVEVVLLTCVLLVTSRGFYGAHAAATGDYDALLAFFTTGYLCLLFFAVHRRVPPPGLVLGAGALISGAVLTKGVAGLIPGVGLVVYVAGTRRWCRFFISRSYLAAAVLLVLVTVGFYFVRELAAPGYIRAVFHNEVSGRYLTTIGGHDEPRTYYLRLLVQSTFSAGPMLLVVAAGLPTATGRARLAVWFSICVAGGILFVFSLAATKLRWYIVPAYPFLSVALAVSAHSAMGALLRSARGRLGPRADRLTAVRCLTLVTAAAVILVIAVYRHVPLATELSSAQANYGRVFEDLHHRGIDMVTVIDGGDRNSEGLGLYTPRLRFYTLLWLTRSLNIREVASSAEAVGNRSGDVVVTCDPQYIERLRVHRTTIAAVGGCISVR